MGCWFFFGGLFGWLFCRFSGLLDWLFLLFTWSVNHLDDQTIGEFVGCLVLDLGRLVGWLEH